MNFHQKDDLRMVQEGALTSFELYDQYRTNKAHEQYGN